MIHHIHSIDQVWFDAHPGRKFRQRYATTAETKALPPISSGMRAQYFAEVTESRCDGDTPAYWERWQKLAALSPDQRPILGTPDAISAALFNLIGQTIERAYGKDLRRVARAIVTIHKDANAHDSATAAVHMTAGAEGG